VTNFSQVVVQKLSKLQKLLLKTNKTTSNCTEDNENTNQNILNTYPISKISTSTAPTYTASTSTPKCQKPTSSLHIPEEASTLFTQNFFPKTHQSQPHPIPRSLSLLLHYKYPSLTSLSLKFK
jgi:hypothetical protein